MKKIISTDDQEAKKNDQKVHFKNDKETEIEIKCGPWHDTLDEAKKDEELFKNNKESFFKMVKE